MSQSLFMLVLYVPEEFLEQVKEAVFAAGAGSVGHYEACCWQTSGRGQFKPGEGSRPFFGKVGETEYVDEYRVEMVCKEEFIDEVVEALKKSHPYETPAYVCWKVRT